MDTLSSEMKTALKCGRLPLLAYPSMQGGPHRRMASPDQEDGLVAEVLVKRCWQIRERWD